MRAGGDRDVWGVAARYLWSIIDIIVRDAGIETPSFSPRQGVRYKPVSVFHTLLFLLWSTTTLVGITGSSLDYCT